MKIHLVRAELFHTDERTDMTKVMVAFRNYANVPKNCSTEQNPNCVMPFLQIRTFD